MAQPLSAEHLALLAALQGGALGQQGAVPTTQELDAAAAALSPQQQQQQQHTPSSGSGYRQRAPTNFRGVTRTSGTTSGESWWGRASRCRHSAVRGAAAASQPQLGR